MSKISEKFNNVSFYDAESGQRLDYQATYNAKQDSYKVYIRLPYKNNANLEKNIESNKATEVLTVSAAEKEFLIDFFIEEKILPNASEKLLQLRNMYFQELKEAESKPGGCSKCKRNSLRRKYVKQVLSLGG